MITKSFFVSLLISASFVLKAQTPDDSLMASTIDSLINHIRLDQTKLIYTKPEGLVGDSSLFRKASYTLHKKKVRITFTDYTSITLNANDFWGLVNDFGQCQRFYKGKKYIVWHTKAPYIYREYASAGRKIKYFYSKTITSEIVPLTKETIYNIADAKTIEQLEAYLKTHDIEKSKEKGFVFPPEVNVLAELEENNLLADFIALHLQIAWAILEILSK